MPNGRFERELSKYKYRRAGLQISRAVSGTKEKKEFLMLCFFPFMVTVAAVSTAWRKTPRANSSHYVRLWKAKLFHFLIPWTVGPYTLTAMSCTPHMSCSHRLCSSPRRILRCLHSPRSSVYNDGVLKKSGFFKNLALTENYLNSISTHSNGNSRIFCLITLSIASTWPTVWSVYFLFLINFLTILLLSVTELLLDGWI